MSDELKTMPERIWCRPIWGNNFSFTTVEAVVSYQDVEYIRADLAAEKPADDGKALQLLRNAFERADLGVCGWLEHIGAVVADNRELFVSSLLAPKQDDIAEKLAGALKMYLIKCDFKDVRVLSKVMPTDPDIRRWKELVNEYEAQKSSGKGGA